MHPSHRLSCSSNIPFAIFLLRFQFHQIPKAFQTFTLLFLNLVYGRYVVEVDSGVLNKFQLQEKNSDSLISRNFQNRMLFTNSLWKKIETGEKRVGKNGEMKAKQKIWHRSKVATCQVEKNSK